MSKLTFENFLTICEQNLCKKYVPELLNLMKLSECIFSSGIVMPYEHILDIYSIRLEIAEEQKKLSENEILDFKNCVESLSEINSEKIGILNIHTENNSYMVFYEPKERIIIGIIKFEKTNSLKDSEKYNDEITQKGYSSKSQKISKDEIIKEWE